jgi:hypothetical protein
VGENECSSDRYVSQESFHLVLELLKENREVLRTQISSVTEQMTGLSTQLDQGVAKITDRQDIANGRTSKNEAAIAVLGDDIKVTQAQVAHLEAHGCRNLAPHKSAIGALAAAGVVPDTMEILDRPESLQWTTAHRARAVGIGIGGLGLGVLAPHVGPFLHWIAHILTGAPQ